MSLTLLRATTLAAALAIGVAACSDSNDPTAPGGEDSELTPGAVMAGDAELPGSEREYLIRLVDDHGFTLQVVTRCAERADRVPLREFCAAQVPVIAEHLRMSQEALQAHYGVWREPELTEKQRRVLGRMDDKAIGPELDRYFLDWLVWLNYLELKVLRHGLEIAVHDHVRAITLEMIEDHEAALAVTKGWFCDWFGQCGEIRE